MWRNIIVIACICALACTSDELPRITKKWRLPGAVNAHQPTIAPVLSPDGRQLYFSRKYYPGNIGGSHDPDDIWVSVRMDDSTWSDPIRLDALNTPNSDVLFGFSADGSVALIQRGSGDGYTEQFALARRTATGWHIEPITIENYTNNSSYYYAFVTPDLSTLLLAIEGNDTHGGLDLYVSHRNDNDSLRWSAPINLGSVVNTRGMESSPFLARDGRTLYYATNGFGSDGKYDIYMSRRLDESWQTWSTPVRLPEPINTGEMDLCWWLFPTGDTAVYISTDSGTVRMGIYLATLARQYQPLPVRPTQWRIYFDFDQATLPRIPIPDSLLDDIKKARRIELEGHTDSLGTTAYNLLLSKRRVDAVRKFLLEQGVASDRMHTAAYGMSKPLAPNTTQQGRALNRRVEIRWSQ